MVVKLATVCDCHSGHCVMVVTLDNCIVLYKLDILLWWSSWPLYVVVTLETVMVVKRATVCGCHTGHCVMVVTLDTVLC